MTLTTWSRRVLAQFPDDVRNDLASGLAPAITGHFGLVVRPAESFGERGAGGWCDGVSIIDSGVILYRPTPSRRQNFTLMHELAHHLVDSNIECLSWLADQPQSPRLLEQLCDQIASDLLISPGEADRILGSTPPDAGAVLALYEKTEASRSVCANAIVRRLPCDGLVVLVEEGADTVFYAARSGDTRPYAWKGDALPAAHPLRRATPPAQTLAWWPYPSGSERREYYMSCSTASGWTVAVLAERNLFKVPGFHIPHTVEEDRGYDGEITCPCGYSGKTRWWPCNECGKSQCPKCSECDCDRRTRQLVACTNCFTSVMPHLLEGGLCDQCR